VGYNSAQDEKRGRAISRFNGCGHCERVLMDCCPTIGQKEITTVEMLHHHQLVSRSRKAKDDPQSNYRVNLVKDGRDAF
jgi:hypothetical protein